MCGGPRGIVECSSVIERARRLGGAAPGTLLACSHGSMTAGNVNCFVPIQHDQPNQFNHNGNHATSPRPRVVAWQRIRRGKAGLGSTASKVRQLPQQTARDGPPNVQLTANTNSVCAIQA